MAASGHASDTTAGGPTGQRVSYLDQALWKKLGEATTAESFADGWLTLQCRMISGVSRGLVLLGPSETGPFTPMAAWPEGTEGSEALEKAIGRATRERRGVVYGHAEAGAGMCCAAYPLVLDDRLHGVVAIEIADRSEEQLREVMRQLQWGSVWIETFYRRQWTKDEQSFHRRANTALELVADAVEQERFKPASLAAVTELALRFDCDRVSLGFVERRHARVVSMSHTAQFGKRMNLVRAIGAAMDEAIDQQSTILYPSDDAAAFQVTAAHADVARSHGASAVVTIPFGAKDRLVGAIAFERSEEKPIDQATLDLMDCVVSFIGPILASKRKEDRPLVVKAWEAGRLQIERLFGPRHYGRKLAAVLALVLVTFFSLATEDYRVDAPAVLEGLVRRAVVAPFDGYILSAEARAGDEVEAGAILASLDDHDLSLERLRWVSTRAQRLAEYNQAMAERKAEVVNVIRAQIDQSEAEIALLDGQIDRARLRAPFDGLIVSGDLSQSVGASVERGKALFEIAPLDAYRVILEVDEGDITEIAPGQSGTVLISAIPDDPMAFTVLTVTPVSEAREGRNFFRVEARLDRTSDRLRPGMKGVAKVDIDARRLIWIWTHKLVDWLRIGLWSWWP